MNAEEIIKIIKKRPIHEPNNDGTEYHTYYYIAENQLEILESQLEQERRKPNDKSWSIRLPKDEASS